MPASSDNELRSLVRETMSGGNKGGGCLILFGLVFAAAGLFAAYFVTKQILAEAGTRTWIETLCQIERCEIVEEKQRDDPFRIEIRYTYDFGPQRMISDRYALKEKWSDSYEKLALRRKALFSGDGAVCYVNPDNPAEAVIHRESWASALIGLIPLVFVAVGSGIIFAGVRMVWPKARSPQPVPVPGAGRSVAGRRTRVIGGLLFTAIGIGAGIPLFTGPIASMAASRNWTATPCTILWSRVRNHDSDDGTTYSVDVFYDYEFDGQAHRSNRYRFMGGSSSSRAAKVAAVRRLPEGSQQVCYVNPKQPERATIVPGFSPVAFVGLVPLILAGIGLAMLASARRPDAVMDLPPGLGGPTAATGDPSGAVVLRATIGRGMKVGGCLIFALFWNGIVSIFVSEAIEGWRVGSPDWFLTIFMIPFVVIGVGVILGFFYQLLAMGNPVPTLTLLRGMPRAGEPLEVAWELRGKVSRLSKLKISLWGVESATYRRGTDTATSREIFYNVALVEAIDPADIRAGRATIPLPEDLVPSLALPNNAILYQIRVSGDIPFWPDLGEEYEVTLLPRRSDPV